MQDFQLDPKYIASGIGSLIGALLHLLRTTLARIPLTTRDAVLGTFEFFLSLMAGFSGAIYFGPSVSKIAFLNHAIDEHAASFAIGIFFYKLLPIGWNFVEGPLGSILEKIAQKAGD